MSVTAVCIIIGSVSFFMLGVGIGLYVGNKIGWDDAKYFYSDRFIENV